MNELILAPGDEAMLTQDAMKQDGTYVIEPSPLPTHLPFVLSLILLLFAEGCSPNLSAVPDQTHTLIPPANTNAWIQGAPSGEYAAVVCRFRPSDENPAKQYEDYHLAFDKTLRNPSPRTLQPVRILGGYYADGSCRALVDLNGLQGYVRGLAGEHAQSVQLRFGGREINVDLNFELQGEAGNELFNVTAKAKPHVQFRSTLRVEGWMLVAERIGDVKVSMGDITTDAEALGSINGDVPDWISRSAVDMLKRLADPFVNGSLQSMADEALRACRVDLGQEIVRLSNGHLSEDDLANIRPTVSLQDDGTLILEVRRLDVEDRIPEWLNAILDSGDAFLVVVFGPGEYERRVVIHAHEDQLDEKAETFEAELISTTYNLSVRPGEDERLVRILAPGDDESDPPKIAETTPRMDGATSGVEQLGPKRTDLLAPQPKDPEQVGDAINEEGSGVKFESKLAVVPDCRKIGLREARELLEKEGLLPVVPNPLAKDEDRVCKQSQPPGKEVPLGTPVYLDPLESRVPNLVDKKLHDAVELVRQSRFKVEFKPLAPISLPVSKQEPRAGAYAQLGSTVSLRVWVRMPSLVGREIPPTRERIKEYMGLGSMIAVPAQQGDLIVAHDPRPGRLVEAGNPRVVVRLMPGVPAPNVVGLPLPSAATTLRVRGLNWRYGARSRVVYSNSMAGQERVIAQGVSPGSLIARSNPLPLQTEVYFTPPVIHVPHGHAEPRRSGGGGLGGGGMF